MFLNTLQGESDSLQPAARNMVGKETDQITVWKTDWYSMFNSWFIVYWNSGKAQPPPLPPPSPRSFPANPPVP